MLDSFTLHLRAEGKADKTIRTYRDAVTKLAREGGVRVADTSRQDIERHIASLLDRYSPAYASNQFRALQQFFRWLADEEDIPNPMASLKAPKAVPPEVPVLSTRDMDALLRTCRGRTRRDRRDTALILLFRDTGCRLAELAGLTLDDIDLRQRECLVTGKGNRQRWVKFSSQAAVAVDRYLRSRCPDSGHRDSNPAQGSSTQGHSATEPLWGMTANGIYQMVKRRGAQAGVKVHPHQFRHNFAHTWLDRGGAEGDLMQLAGWRSAQMLRRYGASAAASRARRSYDRIMG
jgi:integrase/recombinase XerD